LSAERSTKDRASCGSQEATNQGGMRKKGENAFFRRANWPFLRSRQATRSSHEESRSGMIGFFQQARGTEAFSLRDARSCCKLEAFFFVPCHVLTDTKLDTYTRRIYSHRHCSIYINEKKKHFAVILFDCCGETSKNVTKMKDYSNERMKNGLQ